MADPDIFPERPRVAVPCGCVVGEAPIWDARLSILYWVDIKDPALFAWHPHGPGQPVRVAFGERISFVALTPDPDILVLGLKSGIWRFDRRDGSATQVLQPEPDRPDNRLNDASVGPDGTLYFGSMDDIEKGATGTFYRWSPAGLTSFGHAVIVSNGPTVDPERGLVYSSDTVAGRVYRHALAPDGEPGPAEAFVTFQEGWGKPDGITIDVDGHVWIAHFGGARVTRFSPEGEAVLVVPMPTAQVTKVAFGGPGLSTLYVTTAAINRDRETDPLAGHLFAIETGAVGIEPALCRMGLA